MPHPGPFSTAIEKQADRPTVVLYNPRAVFYTMPLALLAVASALDRNRYRVRIVDGRLDEDPERTVVEATRDALCLGVTVLTGAPIQDALAVSRAAKAARPDLPVVWGGWHPSLFPTDTLLEPSVDITVQGQGEVTFGEVLDRLADGLAPGELEGVAGTAFRGPDGPVQNPPRPMTAMNALPPHDYDLIPVERYFHLKDRRQLDYIASTGCHFRCAFCADPFVYRRKWVALEPERMGRELEALWHRWRFRDLNFQDETFFTFPNRVGEISEEILRRGLDFTWAATLRADQGDRLPEETFELCVRSGLRRVMVGVESGSQEMLDWMQKDITVEQVLTTAEMLVRHGVGGIFPFIVGFPGETDQSVGASLDLAKRLRRMSPDFEVPVFYFKPYPGSAITRQVVEQGYELPATIEEWAEFDFIGSAGPWVSPEKHRLIERFKFYNRFAGGHFRPLRWPLQAAARWRCRRDRYGFPVEKLLVERLRPRVRLS